MQKAEFQNLKKDILGSFILFDIFQLTSVSQLPISMINWTRTKNETMEPYAFCIFIDYRGHHRKGVAMYNAT